MEEVGRPGIGVFGTLNPLADSLAICQHPSLSLEESR